MELNKKEFQEFLTNIEVYIKRLEEKLINKYEINKIDFSYDCIDIVEKYFLSIHEMNIEDINEFWAYISEALIFYVGGEYKLASKSEDVAFTPIIINYGYKEKWKIRLSAEVWRDKLIKKSLPKSLVDHIKSINEKYGKN
ncbi:hypothetical protein B4N84_10735 [Flavobacterium sp. IR1]|nr:hypothetical protein B4N84_10735 [Flavobacterium sp. IR1]